MAWFFSKKVIDEEVEVEVGDNVILSTLEYMTVKEVRTDSVLVSGNIHQDVELKIAKEDLNHNHTIKADGGFFKKDIHIFDCDGIATSTKDADEETIASKKWFWN